jgi:hypothetical protein
VRTNGNSQYHSTGADERGRPERILVYDFAVSAQEVKEYQGIMRQQPTIKDAAERERLLAQEVKDALADELIEGLRSLGFRVERAKRGTPATGTDMLIDGQFLTVDEGNPLHSLVIGFGNGASSVQTQVQVYQGPDARKIMEFTTQSDSSKMPGAAATMAAGCGGVRRSNGGDGCRQCSCLRSEDLQIRRCPNGGRQR